MGFMVGRNTVGDSGVGYDIEGIEGFGVGSGVGSIVGVILGVCVGCMVGSTVGETDGESVIVVGVRLGDIVG